MNTISNTNFCGPMIKEPAIDNLTTETTAVETPSSNSAFYEGTPIELGDSSTQINRESENISKEQSQPGFDKLLALVKLIGAAAIAAAMALFLYEGIEITNDIQRFFSILGFGGLLTALGLAVNKWLSDRVASRLFIGLSLGSVPVIASVLGGFTFSLTDAAKSLSLPQYATWELTNTASLYTALPIALIVIGAISALGYMVLTRSEARWLTPAFFVSNALLLIPSRDGATIALIASIAIGALVWVVHKNQVNPISFKTIEGKWALALLFLAPLIMIVRSAVFYDYEVISGTIILVTLYGALRYFFHECESGKKLEIFALLATFLSGVVAAGSLSIFIVEATWSPLSSYGNSGAAIVVLWTLLSLLVGFDFARKNNDWALSRLMNGFTGVMVGGVVVLSALFSSFSWMATLALLAILTTFMLVHYARGWQTEAGILLIIIATLSIQHVDDLLNALLATGWWGLAAAGITAVVGSAIMEKCIKPRPQAA